MRNCLIRDDLQVDLCEEVGFEEADEREEHRRVLQEVLWHIVEQVHVSFLIYL